MKIVKEMILGISNFTNLMFNSTLLAYRNVEYFEKPKINGRMIIVGSGIIRLGRNIRINSSLLSNPIGGDTKTILSTVSGAIIEIGDNTGISNIAIICKKKIKIGKNVLIGGSTKVYDSDFHSLVYEIRNSEGDTATAKPVEIKDGAFIGAHCIILKGVTIGEKSIIGAGSVVTKSVPDGEIWAGNPAKYIKNIGVG